MVMQVPAERAMPAQHFALPVAPQHGPGRHVDGRNVHGDGAHQHRRRGLVAAGQEHRPVHRIGPEQLFHFHGQEVAVEHGGGLHQLLAQRHGRQLGGEAAGLQDAPFDVLDPLGEVGVAGIEVVPGVDDADHRAAGELLAPEPHLLGPGAMAEGTQVVGSEPAVAA
jgi:hypothetical protein